MKKIYLVIAAILLTLTACTPQIVIQKEAVGFHLESDFYQTVPIPPPPPKESFLQQPTSGQRKMLAIYSIELSAALEKANERLLSIERLYVDHRRKVDQMNKTLKED